MSMAYWGLTIGATWLGLVAIIVAWVMGATRHPTPQPVEPAGRPCINHPVDQQLEVGAMLVCMRCGEVRHAPLRAVGTPEQEAAEGRLAALKRSLDIDTPVREWDWADTEEEEV